MENANSSESSPVIVVVLARRLRVELLRKNTPYTGIVMTKPILKWQEDHGMNQYCKTRTT